MVKINLVCVGKIKDKYLLEGINEYLKRLSKYASFQIIEIVDEKIFENSNDSLDKIIKEKESKKVLDKIGNDYSVLLDVYGQEVSSEGFASFLEKSIDNGISKINFIISGSLGPSDELRAKVNKRISLSKMTFTHQMTRLLLLEQIYRAFKINNNEIYHK
ncbi:MAG: 23S rRNA (pseudouridine(1915)-N(3))-methyltransferase RlmH [Erysipelotrichaceae bacterium]|nr:23S rRNA (pseudouridine(1915)-N(3))-methyltransferase RlmH [Erysipelotrichaceae bacterium]